VRAATVKKVGSLPARFLLWKNKRHSTIRCMLSRFIIGTHYRSWLPAGKAYLDPG
jgi:hypothetical protein